MASLLGLDIARTYKLVFTSGALIAGLAGALISPMLSVDPYIGNIYLVRSFFVVTVGGLGELLGGTLVGAFFIGGAETIIALASTRHSPRRSCSRLPSWSCAFGHKACSASDDGHPRRRLVSSAASSPAPGGGRWRVDCRRRGLLRTRRGARGGLRLSGHILPQYMLFGMLALSLGLLWGFIGIVSFGQAAFFALGAYTMGLAMQRTGAPVNPAYIGLLISLLLGGALAGVIGYFLFSAGVRGAYFVIVTLALSIIVEQLAVSQSQITGGWNGMFIQRMSLTFGPLGEVAVRRRPIYYVVLLVVVATFALVKGLSRAPFGKLLVGIRENEDRLIALGVRTSLYKTAAVRALRRDRVPGRRPVAPTPASSPIARGCALLDRSGGLGRHRRSRLLLGALLGGILVASLSNYLSAVVPATGNWRLASSSCWWSSI